MITVDESVLPPGPAPGEQARTGSRGRVIAIALLVAAAAVLAAGSIRVPYYAIAPGDVLDVDGLVRVAEGPSYEARGNLEMVTVSLGRVTALGALRGWLDSDIDVVHADVVKPPEVSDQEFTELNRELMASSKEKAQGVAFEALGEDAIIGDGARVAQVVPGSPAEGVLAVGDVLVAVDGSPVSLDADAVGKLGARRPGDVVRLTIAGEGGARRDVNVTLAARDGDGAKPFLGVQLLTQGLRIQLPRKVEIDSERIGGPSAGLAFTLQVLDELTPGELTGGRRVAATGTIELDGSVGEIGGIVQKTAAVIRAGVDVFLVPTAEFKAARARAGSKVKVIGIDHLDDALRALAALGGSGLGAPAP